NFHDWSANNFVMNTNSTFTPQWIAGTRGYAMQLDGSSYLKSPDTTALSGFSNLTLNCFFYVTNVPSQLMLLSKHSGGTSGEWYLALDGNSQLRFIVVNNASTRVDLFV